MIIIVALIYPLAAVSEVFKTIGPDGTVTFTDEPTNGEKIEVTPLPTYSNPNPAPKIETQPTAGTGTSTESEKKPFVYKDLAITAPAHDSAFWDNSGTVNVSVSVTPGLNLEEEHLLVVTLDGKEIAPALSHRTTLTIKEARGVADQTVSYVVAHFVEGDERF